MILHYLGIASEMTAKLRIKIGISLLTTNDTLSTTLSKHWLSQALNHDGLMEVPENLENSQ